MLLISTKVRAVLLVLELQRGGLPSAGWRISNSLIVSPGATRLVTVALTGSFDLRLTPDTLLCAVWTFLIRRLADLITHLPRPINYTANYPKTKKIAIN